MAVEPTVMRPGGVSYLRIPAPRPHETAAFYAAVFGWTVDLERHDPSFQDGTGHVIGHFVSDIAVAEHAGVRPYVFVDDVPATLEEAVAHGGSIRTEPYPEGTLVVATFADPAGNEIGVWQVGPGS
ncbi:MAG TPA: VOC family protein [Solirubrobacteraceae bacterium]|nr:VOC family protein [Solirubrobacteraceae bacterium]